MVDMTLNDEALRIINDYRTMHGSPKLAMDSSLSQSAQRWAEQLAEHKTMRHSENNKYGEVLAYKSVYTGPIVFSASEACQQWYEQSDIHDFGGEFTYETGYFTQMIWHDCDTIGFGRAVSKDQTMAYIVAHFSPKGNLVGQFNRNIARSQAPALRVSEPDYSGGQHSRPVSSMNFSGSTYIPGTAIPGESEKDRKIREKVQMKEQKTRDKLVADETKAKKKEEDKAYRKSKSDLRRKSRNTMGAPGEETKEQKRAREKAEKDQKKDRKSRSKSDLSRKSRDSMLAPGEESREQKKAREKAEKDQKKADRKSRSKSQSRESIGPGGFEETREQKKAREKEEKAKKKQDEKEYKERAKSLLKEEKQREKEEKERRKSKA